MRTLSDEFEIQLELFREEAQSAIQFFYAWDATHAIAAKDKSVVRLLNQAPLFWNTALGSLQTSTFVTLGRVFDPDSSNHSVTRLVAFAHKNLDIFSKEALAVRKRKDSPNADEWLPEYLENAYVPTNDDFRRLKRHVALRRKTYQDKYRPVRHKVYAHRGEVTKPEISALFSKIDLRELRQLLVFLGRLYETLWELYYNGRKPLLRKARFSVARILDQPSPNSRQGDLQERMIQETKDFFMKNTISDRARSSVKLSKML